MREHLAVYSFEVECRRSLGWPVSQLTWKDFYDGNVTITRRRGCGSHLIFKRALFFNNRKIRVHGVSFVRVSYVAFPPAWRSTRLEQDSSFSRRAARVLSRRKYSIREAHSPASSMESIRNRKQKMHSWGTGTDAQTCTSSSSHTIVSDDPCVATSMSILTICASNTNKCRMQEPHVRLNGQG
jgi:hypothetical protein